MRHAEAARALPELRSGRLDRATRAQVLSHLEVCDDCRDWLAIYDLLQAEFGGDTVERHEHPDSALVALCVVRPEELDEPNRQGLAEHLSNCPTCQDELEKTRAAVHAGRPGSIEEGRKLTSSSPSPARHLAKPLALAATVVIGVFLLAMAWRWDILDKESTRTAVEMSRPSRAGAIGSTEPVEPISGNDVQTLSGKDLQGTQVIRSESRLAASDLEVTPGADVTLEAGEAITLGDGFRVASGGRLTVAVTSPGIRDLKEKLP